MYEYILHCLKTTYKYFALPPNAPAGPKATGLASDFSQLSVQSQPADHHKPQENGPDDSDCIIEEEEDVEEYSDSDEEREKEKADPGKSSLSEEDEDEDVESRNRRHLDSFTTEEEEIFPVDEISGEELLSDEEGPDPDTAGSGDEDDEEVELTPVKLEDAAGAEGPETQTRKEKKLSYEFSKQAFSRGKVGAFGSGSFNSLRLGARVASARGIRRLNFQSLLDTHGCVQLVQTRRAFEEGLPRRFQESATGPSARFNARVPQRS